VGGEESVDGGGGWGGVWVRGECYYWFHFLMVPV
jgi:hypothetical protein